MVTLATSTTAIAGAQTTLTCAGLPATIVATNADADFVEGTDGADVIVLSLSGVLDVSPILSARGGDDHICVDDASVTGIGVNFIDAIIDLSLIHI